MYEIDQWFPGFTIFILVLMPVMVVAIYLMIMAMKYFNLRFKPVSQRRQKVAKWLNLPIVAYMIFPLYDIASYFNQDLDSVSDRLFSVHLVNLTFIIIIVGIAQVFCYASYGRDNA